MDKISLGPKAGALVASRVLYGGSPTLQSGGQNHKCPTMGRLARSCLTFGGVPNTSQRGTKSENDHTSADGLRNPTRLRGPQRFRVGSKIRSGPQVRGWAMPPPPYGGSPTLQRRGQNEQWPTRGRIGYVTPAVWGFANASQWGTRSAEAHEGAGWLHQPGHLRGP